MQISQFHEKTIPKYFVSIVEDPGKKVLILGKIYSVLLPSADLFPRHFSFSVLLVKHHLYWKTVWQDHFLYSSEKEKLIVIEKNYNNLI
jgi:hypothetical protein